MFWMLIGVLFCIFDVYCEKYFYAATDCLMIDRNFNYIYNEDQTPEDWCRSRTRRQSSFILPPFGKTRPIH